ncbi:MAG TPA: S53 family peptidase [Candidatus Eremiobacteraceae bacterium]|nr:S53 family peptidase [Candidatus Eremiobacteraceae bacterium]
MTTRKNLPQILTGVSTLFIVLTLMTSFGFSQSANHNAQKLVGTARDLGPEDASKQITVNVWLNPHNKTALDKLVKQMYEEGSPNYHRWLTMEQYKASFAPTARDAAVVREFLESHNLSVSAIEKNNHYITAQGRVGDIQNAFNVQVNRLNIKGAIHSMATKEPSVTGPAGALVAAVQVSDLGYSSYSRPAIDPDTGVAYSGVPVSSGPSSNGLFFSADCLRPPETQTFTTGGGNPTAVYFGNRYGADITSGVPNLPSCGYDSAEIQTAYGLDGLYKNGLDGAGQTIVIVDAFGSNTILADANLFSSLNGLPLLTPSNFQIVGATTCTATPKDTAECLGGGWNLETTLDVEWAHSIAPGANIALVLAADNSFTNLDAANLFAVENKLGNVISNSFGIQEIILAELAPSELVVENNIAELAAATGISLDVSSGDSGDFVAVDEAELGVAVASVSANADSPFATGVGGTSTFLDAHNNIELETGWGLNETRIANPTPNPPVIPPLQFGFIFGAGGGTSAVYAKPSFQKSLPGSGRLVPDVSMNADPETGSEIIVTPDSVPGDPQFVEVFGGTSLSCRMFSGLWAIANQAAGTPLGQAAPYLYKLHGGAISDVTDLTFASLFNVFGIIFDPPAAPTFESPNSLAGPLQNTTDYVSALFQSSTSTRWDVFTFGTDSSLTVGFGWDNVTGVGTPNGVPFVAQVVAQAK